MAIFEKIIKIKEQGAKQTENRLGSLVKTGLTIGAVTVAFKAFANQMKAASQAAAEQEKIFKSLETAVNLSGVSYKDNEKALRDLFATQQQYTKYGDTDSAQMLSRLIQLSGDYEGSVKALETAQDLASTGMFDMNTAARYVGMALAGNVEMLGRYIPELRAGSDGLKDLTTKAEKTEYAMKLLNEKFGGTARAELDTYAGQVQQLQNYIGDYREMIGDKLNPVLKVGAERLTEFFRRATETKLDTTIRQLQEMGAAAEEIAELTKLSGLANAISDMEKSQKRLNKLMLSTTLPTNLLDQFTKVEKATGFLVEDWQTQRVLIDDYEKALAGVNSALDIQKAEASSLSREYLLLLDKGDALTKQEKNRINDIEKLAITNTSYQQDLIDLRKELAKYIDAERLLRNVSEDNNETMTNAENVADRYAKKIEELGIKNEWTTEQTIAFKQSIDDLNRSMTAGAARSYFTVEFGDVEIDKQIKDLKAKYESGNISEITFKALLAQLEKKQIEESILQPLDEIDVPEIHIYTDEQLQTDIQNIQGFVDKYSDEIDNITSIASGAGRIWENIIESRYNKDLKALKDTARYQKATNDERKVMEEDLYNSFADEREKYSKYQKAAAIAEAIINTAAAVVEALPNYALAGLTAAAGITQIGIIASQPIPQYAEGGLLPSNQKLFIANESGQEAILNAETTARLGSSGVDTLNSGGSLGNVMYININNPLLLENQQIDLVADMIVKRARQGFNDLEVRFN